MRGLKMHFACPFSDCFAFVIPQSDFFCDKSAVKMNWEFSKFYENTFFLVKIRLRTYIIFNLMSKAIWAMPNGNNTFQKGASLTLT